MASIPSGQLSLFEGKVCHKCQQWKPFEKFRKHREGLWGYEGRCRECMVNKQREKEYHARKWRENLEESRAYARERYRKHKAKQAAYGKVYYAANKEQIAAYHAERRRKQIEAVGEAAFYEQERARAAVYRASDPDQLAKGKHNYRARKVKAGGTWSAKEWRALVSHYGPACLRCGKVAKLYRDHVIPLVKGGRNDITNLQGLCNRCNCIKHTDTTDYRPDLGAWARALKGEP